MRIGNLPPTGGAPGFGGAPQAAIDAAIDMKAQMQDIGEANRLMSALAPNEKASYIARINQDLANIAQDLKTLNKMKGLLPTNTQDLLQAASSNFQTLTHEMQKPNPDPAIEIMELQGDADNLADIIQR